MNRLTVQQAAPSELDDVAELFDGYRQFYGQPGDIQAARRFLSARAKHGESVVFVARDGVRAVGFTQLYPAFSSVSLAHTFILNDLFVHPEARRQGVATKLLQAAEEHARSLGAIRLTLSTAIANQQAQALYRAAGWRQDDQFYVFHRATRA